MIADVHYARLFVSNVSECMSKKANQKIFLKMFLTEFDHANGDISVKGDGREFK